MSTQAGLRRPPLRLKLSPPLLFWGIPPCCALPPPGDFPLSLPRRSTQIKTYSWDNAQVLLVGNKCDMEDERVVSSEKGRQLAEHLGEWEGGGTPRHPGAAIFLQII